MRVSASLKRHVGHEGARSGADVAELFYRLGFFALLAFVFTIPWEGLTLVSGADTISKMVGFVAAPISVAGICIARRIRGHPFLWVALLFVAWSWITYMWTSWPEITLQRDFSLLELWIFAWLVFQYVRTERLVRFVLSAYALGSVVTSIALLKAFMGGAVLQYSGFTSGYFNPNALAYYVALAATMSWYVGYAARRSSVRLLFWAITVLSVATVLLTASRGGAIILGTGLVYAVMSLRKLGILGKVVALAALGLAVWLAINLTPIRILGRLATITSQLQGGTLDHRTLIWGVGLFVFPAHPFFGTGTATFMYDNAPIWGFPQNAHNDFLKVLVETGLVGFILWCAMFGCAGKWLFRRAAGADRAFWMIIGIQLIMVVMTANFEFRKPVWLILALLVSAGVMARRKVTMDDRTAINLKRNQKA